MNRITGLFRRRKREEDDSFIFADSVGKKYLMEKVKENEEQKKWNGFGDTYVRKKN